MPGYNTEADYENAIIELFRNDLGYEYVYGPDVERDFKSPLYDSVLEESLYRLNKGLPADAINDALFKLRNFENGELVQKNAEFMEYLQSGIPVRYLEKGEERSGIVYLADYSHPENNSFIVANQWTFIENSNKRPDVILFLNGLPVVLVELKSPSREETDASEAYRQLRNYMQEIPSMFIYNAICAMSDQSTSKAGTITSGEDRFMEWKTKDGSYENTQYAQFDTFFEGLFQKDRLLDIIKNFICFSNEGIKSFKILAGYHQYFAVRKAIESTKHATVTDGKGGGKKISLPEMNARINELLKQSIKSDGVINLFSDVNSEFSLFDPKFLEEISKMKEKNLAVELLKKLIAEQVQIYRRTNVVKSEKFSEIMQRAMNAYLNGMLTNEQVIDEMMKLAKQIAAAHNEGKELGLTADELAFYDALTKPQAIKDFYENDELIAITKELAETLRKNRTIDWNRREQARARMRMLIKRLLKKHKYPPEGMDDAVQTVMTQCELWTDNMEE